LFGRAGKVEEGRETAEKATDEKSRHTKLSPFKISHQELSFKVCLPFAIMNIPSKVQLQFLAPTPGSQIMLYVEIKILEVTAN
jgi:hypothetical protein